MRFPYTLWTIAIPGGGHCPFLTRGTRAEAIAAAVDYHVLHCDPFWTWKKAHRQGWRAVKLSVRPA